jgi:hypothetical protein
MNALKSRLGMGREMREEREIGLSKTLSLETLFL